MASQTQVRVDLRSINLSHSADLAELPDGSFFVTLDEPPPVRTVLAVKDEDGETRAFEVCHVVEIGEAGPTGARGCQGRFVASDRLEQQHGVGSEHLTPGEPQPSRDSEGSDDETPPEVASAPVEAEVSQDTTYAQETAEAPQDGLAEETEALSRADEAPPEEPPAEASTAPAETAPEEPAATETTEPTSGRPVVTSSGGKKRKGRKRK